VAPKRLELLHELLPSATTMALIINPAVPALAGPGSRLSLAAANALDLQLRPYKPIANAISTGFSKT
jgi:putative ABC transport system substrate-binding protein